MGYRTTLDEDLLDRAARRRARQGLMAHRARLALYAQHQADSDIQDALHGVEDNHQAADRELPSVRSLQ